MTKILNLVLIDDSLVGSRGFFVCCVLAKWSYAEILRFLCCFFLCLFLASLLVPQLFLFFAWLLHFRKRKLRTLIKIKSIYIKVWNKVCIRCIQMTIKLRDIIWSTFAIGYFYGDNFGYFGISNGNGPRIYFIKLL